MRHVGSARDLLGDVGGTVISMHGYCVAITRVAHSNKSVPLCERVGDVDPNFEKVDNIERECSLIAALPDGPPVVLALRFLRTGTQIDIAERIGISQLDVSCLLFCAL